MCALSVLFDLLYMHFVRFHQCNSILFTLLLHKKQINKPFSCRFTGTVLSLSKVQISFSRAVLQRIFSSNEYKLDVLESLFQVK